MGTGFQGLTKLFKSFEELSSDQVLEDVYRRLFERRSKKLRFPKNLHSEVDRDDMKCSGMAERYMFYESGKIVNLEGLPWLISLGRHGRRDFNVSRDLIALQTEYPEEIERQTRYFNYSLIQSRTSGSLVTPNSKFRNELEGLLEGIGEFVYEEMDLSPTPLASLTGLSLLKSPRTYRSEIVDLLTKRIEARLQIIAEKNYADKQT